MPKSERISVDSCDDFVEWRVHECYLWFREPVIETERDVEEYFKAYFSPNFAIMLEERPKAVWRKRKNWLKYCAVRLGELSVDYATANGKARCVRVHDVEQAIRVLQTETIEIAIEDGNPLEVNCTEAPTRGGWCGAKE